MSSRRRKAGIVFCIVFALLLLIVVIAFFAVRSVFTDTSVRRTPVAEINPQDYRMAQLKTAGEQRQYRIQFRMHRNILRRRSLSLPGTNSML